MYLRGSTWVALCAIAGVLAWSQLTAPPAHQPETEISPGAASSSGLRKPLLLIRRGKTEEARQELRRLLDGDPTNAEIWYQIARSYLMDFHAGRDPRRARMSLSLAMEALANTLKGDPDHVYALQAKSVIHARAELLYYDPNLAYDLATRVARLQPYANEYLLGLAEWMSGEVRFTGESGHRVPHDPLLGLDRAAGILERVIDGAVPYSNEESAALFLMAKTLAKRGRFADSLEFYDLTLSRPATDEQRMAVQRELGASLYHMGRYGEAARAFYAALEVRINAVDQWLLKVALEAWKQELSDLPPEFVFPAAAPPVTGAQLAFADIAKDLGVNRLDGNGTCAWGDYDGDGDQDLLLAGSGTFIALYRNDGGRFVEVTAAAGLDRVPSGYSLNVIDYDNDGKLDIYLALNGWSGPMANRLYRNLGNGRFQDVSKESGAADAGS
ncbi:MAG: VCBS repeat-containing protein, partial [Acidobacteria bacterium]|nr:VCBS repeat-containing protein [Acidobacteriota bacterium]